MTKSATKTATKAASPTTATSDAKAAPPWDRANPKGPDGRTATHLTPPQKAQAKRRATAAGRPYPNLVDNMHEAAKRKKPAAGT